MSNIKQLVPPPVANSMANLQAAANAMSLNQPAGNTIQQQQQQQQPGNIMSSMQPAQSALSNMQAEMNAALAGMQQPVNVMNTMRPGNVMQQPGMHTNVMSTMQQPAMHPTNVMSTMHQPGMHTTNVMPTMMQQPVMHPSSALVTKQPHFMKGEYPGKSMFMGSSDENAMMRQILDTHSPASLIVGNVKPLLHVVQDILSFTSAEAAMSQGNHMEGKAYQGDAATLLEALSHLIDRISCEISKCLCCSEGHLTTISILNLLTNYPWVAKLVISLAAFAFSYGEFWLLAQLFSSNQLARSMAILKQVPLIMEHSGSTLKNRFDAVNNLINLVMDLTLAIIKLEELPTMHISMDSPPMSSVMEIIPTAVYWSIRSTVACATHISCLTSMGHEYTLSTTELTWEISILTQRIKQIHEHFMKNLATCYQYIDEKLRNAAYEQLKIVIDTPQIDNMKLLKLLIYAKDDIQPLIECPTKRRVSLDVLRRKNVLLLISGLDILPEELQILEQIYNESRAHLYELVWMPIVDFSHVGHGLYETIPTVKRLGNTSSNALTTTTTSPYSSALVPMKNMTTTDPYNYSSEIFKQHWTDPMQKRFDELISTMPWYSVAHPSIIDQNVIRFVKERWHLRNKPILVVLDPQGRELSPNAIHMMWIWGTAAFPFTSIREENLWMAETWRLELLVNGMDPTIENIWIKDGRFIILYGGDDIDWIRRFTNTAREVARKAGITLEMAYVGRSNKKETVRKAISAITKENLSYCWTEPTLIWYFWTRLESMLFSKIQVKKTDDFHDPLMQEIKKLLSYDKSGGWGLLCKGSQIITSGHAQTVISTLVEYEDWMNDVPNLGFDGAFGNHHNRLHLANPPCCRFEFPVEAGRIPDVMICPECQRHMDKHVTFLCCHEEVGTVTRYATI